jgi:hypothetical protein
MEHLEVFVMATILKIFMPVKDTVFGLGSVAEIRRLLPLVIQNGASYSRD